MTPGRSSEPVSPQATAAAEEMPHEGTTNQCSPAATAPGGTGPAEPDLPTNRNTESNSRAKANTGAAKCGGKRKRTVDDDASPEIKPPFYLRNRHKKNDYDRCSLHGTVGGKPGLVVTSCTNMDTPKFKEIMGWLLAEAQSELVFKTKAGAVRQRDKLIGRPLRKLSVQWDSE